MSGIQVSSNANIIEDSEGGHLGLHFLYNIICLCSYILGVVDFSSPMYSLLSIITGIGLPHCSGVFVHV